MYDSNRRGFLATSAAAALPFLSDLGFLAAVSQAAADRFIELGAVPAGRCVIQDAMVGIAQPPSIGLLYRKVAAK